MIDFPRASRPMLRTIALVALAVSTAGQRLRHRPATPLTPGRLLVSGFESDAVHAYRAFDGKPVGAVVPVPGAQSITQGPDGFFYVCAEDIDEVLRVSTGTLSVVDAFVFDDPGTPEDETGGLDGPTAAFFHGSDLYVASFETDEVLRYDGATGAFEGVFVSAGDGGLNGPDAGTTFGPDGHLYVPSFWNHRVLRFHGRTGAFLDEFVPAGSGTLTNPRDLAFRGGYLYVASSGNDQILRYAPDGTFVDQFATHRTPYSLAFHPDDGDLYVVSLLRNNVRVFDGEAGAFLRRIVINGAGGLAGATYIGFVR